jgi:RNA binding exosome subunit
MRYRIKDVEKLFGIGRASAKKLIFSVIGQQKSDIAREHTAENGYMGASIGIENCEISREELLDVIDYYLKGLRDMKVESTCPNCGYVSEKTISSHIRIGLHN